MFENSKSQADLFIDEAADKVNHAWGAKAFLYGAVAGGVTGFAATHQVALQPNTLRSGKNLAILATGTVIGAVVGGYVTQKALAGIVDHFRDETKTRLDHTFDRTSDAISSAQERALALAERKTHGLVKKSAVERVAATLSDKNESTAR
jgi:hypothetical protein